MTTKKHSLLDRKVLKDDLNDPMALLHPKNINKEMLLEYIRDACDYCTDYQLPHLDFALNHHGEPDVALFDFTSMFAAGFASHVYEKNQRQLLFGLVGDGLLEPFWPTGTGIARGFLGGMDAVWMVRQWAAGELSPIEIMEEREAILKLLPQTTSENLTKDFKNISIEPRSRYPNIPIQLIRSQDVRHQYKSDCPDNADLQRFRHQSYQEVATKFQLRKQKPTGGFDALRIARDPRQDRESITSQASDASAADFYQAMREKRRNEMNAEKDQKKQNDKIVRKSSITSDSSGPTLTLKERIEARRSALDKEEGERTISLNDIATKAEFVRKMSKTFGYGMPSNAETKQDTLTSEAEKCALLVKSANRKNNVNKPKRRKSGDKEAKKSKAKTVSREREPGTTKVETWDFSKEKKSDKNALHSSVAPIVPELDIEIDPELDLLLAQLEHDDSFSKLGENEQKAWLESLFFQDTTHLPGRFGVNNPRERLNPAKSRPKKALRVNKAGDGGEEGEAEAESVTAVHVNDKMKNLAQDFFKADKQTNRNSVADSPIRKLSEPVRHSISKEDSPSSPCLSRKSSINSYTTPPTSRKSSSIEESCDRISGVNDSLCTLAQSYFKSPQKAPSVSQKGPVGGGGDIAAAKDEEHKASLVASFFGPAGTGKQQSQGSNQAEYKIPERASFEPEGNESVSDEEDDEIERMIKAAEAELKEKRESAPPVPAR